MKSLILSALLLAAPALSNACERYNNVKCQCPDKELFVIGKMCSDKEYQGSPEWFKDVKQFEKQCKSYGQECFGVVGN